MSELVPPSKRRKREEILSKDKHFLCPFLQINPSSRFSVRTVVSVDMEQNSYAQVRGVCIFHYHTQEKIRFPVVCAVLYVFFIPNKLGIAL